MQLPQHAPDVHAWCMGALHWHTNDAVVHSFLSFYSGPLLPTKLGSLYKKKNEQPQLWNILIRNYCLLFKCNFGLTMLNTVVDLCWASNLRILCRNASNMAEYIWKLIYIILWLLFRVFMGPVPATEAIINVLKSPIFYQGSARRRTFLVLVCTVM